MRQGVSDGVPALPDDCGPAEGRDVLDEGQSIVQNYLLLCRYVFHRPFFSLKSLKVIPKPAQISSY